MRDSTGYSQNPFETLVRQAADLVVERIAGQQDEPDFLSPRTIARRLDCSVSEVRRHLQQAGIQTLRFGRRGYRVDRRDFERHIERWKKGGELWD